MKQRQVKRRKRVKPQLNNDVLTHIMSFSDFLTAFRMAHMNSRLHRFFVTRLWSVFQREHQDIIAQLTKHRFSQLLPCRLANFFARRCEVCGKGRCHKVKTTWGVFAHQECIKHSTMNSYHAKSILPDVLEHAVSAEVRGYNPRSTSYYGKHWSADYVWKTPCVAFQAGTTVDEICMARFRQPYDMVTET